MLAEKKYRLVLRKIEKKIEKKNKRKKNILFEVQKKKNFKLTEIHLI